MEIKQQLHVDFYSFLNELAKNFPEVFDNNPYKYYRWEDAVLDYIDILRLEPEASYILRRPDKMTPYHMVNEYIESMFNEYFPNSNLIYLDA